MARSGPRGTRKSTRSRCARRCSSRARVLRSAAGPGDAADAPPQVLIRSETDLQSRMLRRRNLKRMKEERGVRNERQPTDAPEWMARLRRAFQLSTRADEVHHGNVD